MIVVEASPAVSAEIRSVSRRRSHMTQSPICSYHRPRVSGKPRPEPSVFLQTDRPDQFAVTSGLAHTERDGLVAFESTYHFAIDPVVEPELDLDQMNPVVAHDRHAARPRC